MATTTTKLGLRKPDPNPTTGDNVNVVTDVNDSMDKLDAAMGFTICTSGTRPGSPFEGQAIWETDTDRMYVWAEAAWRQIVGTTGTVASAILTARGSTGDGVLQSRVTGDANDRLIITADGAIYTGPGSAVWDTKIYRSAVGTIKTDGDFNYGAKSLGRGYIGANTYLANSAVLSATGTEVVFPSATWANEPTYALLPGRLYRGTLKGVCSGDTANNTLEVRIRKGAAAIAGTTLYWGDQGVFVAGIGVTLAHTMFFKNAGGVTVNSKLTLTLKRSAGTGNVYLGGDSNRPLVLAVQDIGAIADHPEISSTAIGV